LKVIGEQKGRDKRAKGGETDKIWSILNRIGSNLEISITNLVDPRLAPRMAPCSRTIACFETTGPAPRIYKSVALQFLPFLGGGATLADKTGSII
jgi:hypothetical protein